MHISLRLIPSLLLLLTLTTANPEPPTGNTPLLSPRQNNVPRPDAGCPRNSKLCTNWQWITPSTNTCEKIVAPMIASRDYDAVSRFYDMNAQLMCGVVLKGVKAVSIEILRERWWEIVREANDWG